MNRIPDFNSYPGKNKVIIISAPSGAGKTTIVRRVMEKFGNLEFSVSATSRRPRHNERHGVDYFFIEAAEFLRHINQGKFVEWEEVYAGTHYGTLISEVERIWEAGKSIIFDVDVKGGIRLKDIFKTRALSIFIMPPSIEELRERLVKRGTDSDETIDKRVFKAGVEIMDAVKFDITIINSDLDKAVGEVSAAIKKFLES